MSSQWQAIPLGEICQIDIGGTPSRSEESYWWKSQEDGERFPWVSISDMKERVINDTKESITRLGKEKSNVKHITKGTLLMSFKLTVGRLVFAGTNLFTNEAIAALRTTEIIDRDFLYYGLQYWNLMDDTDQAVKGVTLNKQKLQEIICTLPPLPEQKKIAEILSGIDRRRCVYETKKAKILKLVEAVISCFFVDVASTAPLAEIGSFGMVVTGSTPPTSDKSNYGKGIPFITPGDIEDNIFVKTTKTTLSASGLKKTRVIPSNSVCVVCIGSTIGKVAISVRESATNQQINSISPGNYDPNYLLAAILHYNEEIRKTASTHAVPIINKSRFSEILIPRPSIDDQKRLGRFIISSYSSVELLDLLLKKNTFLAQSVASDLLSGRKRVSI